MDDSWKEYNIYKYLCIVRYYYLCLFSITMGMKLDV